MLLTHIPAAPVYNHSGPLRREDYPNIRFWTRQDWNSSLQENAVLEIDQDEDGEAFPDPGPDELEEPHQPPARGKRRAAQGINVAMKYIEREDGTVVDGFYAAEIRRYARSLWAQMALDNKLPATWSDVDAGSLAAYNGISVRCLAVS